jgi:hypothetical protein
MHLPGIRAVKIGTIDDIIVYVQAQGGCGTKTPGMGSAYTDIVSCMLISEWTNLNTIGLMFKLDRSLLAVASFWVISKIKRNIEQG